jgi:hypothetical protein
MGRKSHPVAWPAAPRRDVTLSMAPCWHAARLGALRPSPGLSEGLPRSHDYNVGRHCWYLSLELWRCWNWSRYPRPPERRALRHIRTTRPLDVARAFWALLFGSSTGWSPPPRSDGGGTSQIQGEQRIPGPTIVPNSRARRRLQRSKLPAATGSPAMTSGAADPSPQLRHATTKQSLTSQGRCAAAIAHSQSAPYRLRVLPRQFGAN